MRGLPACVAALAGLAVSVSAADRPNIVLCMADDQGWGDTGYNGHPVLQTPNLDAMAGAGLRFDRFYAAAPVCTPTRGSVMTGRHPNRYGCFKWGHSLRPQEVTLAERLQAAGYATGHFGKWHLGSVLADSPVNPGSAGFDGWLSAPNFYDNDPILSREGRAVQLQGESSMVAADAAIAFMQEQHRRNRPFLAVIWFGSPHLPHRAMPADLAPYADQGDQAHWLGEITGLDRAVGRLRAALRDLNIQEQTLFWYTSDNGGLREASSGGRAKKGSIYEGGLRVPAIVEWPGRLDPRPVSAVATTSDIYPTVLALLGIEPALQPPLDGVSLLPLLEGGDRLSRGGIGFWNHPARGISTPSETWMSELLAAQAEGKPYHDQSRLRLDAAVIRERHPVDSFPGHAAWLAWPWKLHRIQPGKGDNAQPPRWELYDLARDPLEKRNRAADEPGRVEAMRSDLEAWLGSVIHSLNGGDYRAPTP